MFEIVLLGTTENIEYNLIAIKNLLWEYGARLDPDCSGSHTWVGPGSSLQCEHIRILGIDDIPRSKLVAQMMKLPGVYEYCPEHQKHALWEHVWIGSGDRTP
jgi:hypothetical protein